MVLSRLKGFALVDGRPSVECVYSVVEGHPYIKCGLEFYDLNLYKAINMFYREEKIKSTWIKFQFICMYAISVSIQLI